MGKSGAAGIAAGGLFNTVVQGTGWVAVTTKGTPVVLSTDAPTAVDSNAVVCWSANLQTSIVSSFSFNNLIGRGSGEALQVGFSGQGWVVVQPAEFDLSTANQGGEEHHPGSSAAGGVGGALGGLLGR